MPGKEPLFRFVLNHSQELIFRYDSYGYISYANERAVNLTGYTQDELMGSYICTLFKDVYCIVDYHVALADEYRDKEEIETFVYRKNQTCFPVIMTTASIIYEDEVSHFCMIMDVTSYKESIRKLEDKTEEVKDFIHARDSFVASVTQELRTPVNGIKGNTELLMEQEHDLQKLGTLKMILDSCTTMEAIINNILDFSKLQAGKFQIEENPFSFREFMRRKEKEFSAMATRKGLRFTVNVAEDVPDKLIGDELRLTQILNNLVSNAVKFTAQGYIGIEVTKNTQIQDEVELFFVVADTGIGISKEDKDKLFQSFTQVDASITRKYGGTGLGLSITKELVNMMHGDIWAEGEKGRGTTFSFTIHLKRQDMPEQEETESAQIYSAGIPLSGSMEVERELMYEFGGEINERELRSNFEKMNLSADMGNWYKAENYAAMVKQLLQESSRELQRAVFRMEMAVRKSDYDKFRQCAEDVKALMAKEWEQVRVNGKQYGEGEN